jgi:hypothetical protein
MRRVGDHGGDVQLTGAPTWSWAKTTSPVLFDAISPSDHSDIPRLELRQVDNFRRELLVRSRIRQILISTGYYPKDMVGLGGLRSGLPSS